jgi:hypothetical protein
MNLIRFEPATSDKKNHVYMGRRDENNVFFTSPLLTTDFNTETITSNR